MLNQRKRAVVWAVAAMVMIWVVAATGFFISKSLKVTAEKVKAYVGGVDLSKLSGAERARAIQKLADMLNNLSAEERQRLRLGRTQDKWFEQMTEAEKGEFIEATMPTGFKQMITAFEQMPEDKRRRAVDDAVKRLHEARDKIDSGELPKEQGTDRPPPISPELEKKVREIGLKSFYSQSSAQTKAELAPLLEEMQKNMEGGGAFRRGRR